MSEYYELADGTKSTDYTVGDKFVVVDSGGHYAINNGDIVTYVEDDGTDCPLFNDDIYIYWYRLAKYQPRQVVVETQPTEDSQSELEEAYAKIDTLESALEDAAREILDLRAILAPIVNKQ